MTTCTITSNGAGDAFKGDKYVNNGVINSIVNHVTDALSLEPIKPNLIQILKSLQEGKVSSALQRLETISGIPTLNQEAKLAVSCLKIILVDSNEVATDDLNRIEAYNTSQQLSSFTKGLAEAALLKLIEQKRGFDIARQRFEDISKTLNDISIPRYFYITKLAKREDLEIINKNDEVFSTLSDFELFALFDSSVNLSMFTLASKALEKLKKLNPLREFERENIILQCISIQNKINKDFYRLSYKDKVEFDKLCTELVLLIDALEFPDFKLMHILCNFFCYSYMTNESMNDCIERNRKIIETKNFFDIEVLQNRYLCTLNEGYEALHQCEPEELMLMLVNQKEEEICKFNVCNLLYQSGDNDLIVGTLNRLSEKNTIASNANLIALAALSSPILERNEFPYENIESAINSFKNTSLNPSFINIVTQELAINGYPELALLLTDMFFGDDVPWLSEYFYSHLCYLHASRQFQTLENKLNRLSNEEKYLDEVVTLFSLIAENQNDYLIASHLLRKSIDNYQKKVSLEDYEKRKLVYLWVRYLNSVYMQDQENARKLTYEVPLSVFDNYFDDYSWQLAFYFSHRIEDVGERIIDWFLNDPQNNAKYYFKLIFHAS
ncbi:hypothetical protein [Shewanella fodinae]|uniref:hypothetical protein n=1 Tax=Shewanella fodinae TaxID=552357 RepID=UPI0016727FA4|nr:hypothetical protein [Shewanella fodinae]MCL2906730.1 hypothetical protein [Shewanella fodinae]GGZ02843.1 hypothetical protein GCM10007169_19560 [Shewanella fodinae]